MAEVETWGISERMVSKKPVIQSVAHALKTNQPPAQGRWGYDKK